MSCLVLGISSSPPPRTLQNSEECRSAGLAVLVGGHTGVAARVVHLHRVDGQREKAVLVRVKCVPLVILQQNVVLVPKGPKAKLLKVRKNNY